MSAEKPAADHAWNTVEAGERATRYQPLEPVLENASSTSNVEL